jgi:hypothetical protein
MDSIDGYVALSSTFDEWGLTRNISPLKPPSMSPLDRKFPHFLGSSDAPRIAIDWGSKRYGSLDERVMLLPSSLPLDSMVSPHAQLGPVFELLEAKTASPNSSDISRRAKVTRIWQHIIN